MSELAPIAELPTEKEDFDDRLIQFGEVIESLRTWRDSCDDPDEREKILIKLQRFEAQFDYLMAHYPDRGDEEPAAPYIPLDLLQEQMKRELEVIIRETEAC